MGTEGQRPGETESEYENRRIESKKDWFTAVEKMEDRKSHYRRRRTEREDTEPHAWEAPDADTDEPESMERLGLSESVTDWEKRLIWVRGVLAVIALLGLGMSVLAAYLAIRSAVDYLEYLRCEVGL